MSGGLRALCVATLVHGWIGCATPGSPTPQTPATAEAAPPPKPVCPEVDPSKIGEAAKFDQANQESLAKVAEEQARVAALEKLVAELRDKLAHVPPPDAKTKEPEPPPAREPTAKSRAKAPPTREPGTPAPEPRRARIEEMVVATGHRARVRLPNELLFTPGEIRITRAGRRALADIAEVFKQTPSERIQIHGHTDGTPAGRKWEDNWQLSLERARQVVVFLIAHGVDPKRLEASGFADTDPVDTADSDEARARNRRVEMFIEPTGKAPPSE